MVNCCWMHWSIASKNGKSLAPLGMSQSSPAGGSSFVLVGVTIIRGIGKAFGSKGTHLRAGTSYTIVFTKSVGTWFQPCHTKSSAMRDESLGNCTENVRGVPFTMTVDVPAAMG